MQQSNRHGFPKASVTMGLCVSSERIVSLDTGRRECVAHQMAFRQLVSRTPTTPPE